MPELPQLLMFVAAGWLLNLTPGPDVLYIITQALRAGVRAGCVAALGIASGCLVHVAAAAAGVGAVLAASSTAFSLLKWLGAGYLLWIGLRMLLQPQASTPATLQPGGGASTDPGLWAVYRRGFLTNVLNPKVALFFLAFVPQFIQPDAPQPALIFLLLGLLFVVNSLPVNFAYAALAAWLATRLQAVRRALAVLDRAAGVLFIGFGLRLAMVDNPGR